MHGENIAGTGEQRPPVIVLPQAGSTNDELRERWAASTPEGLPHLATVVTDTQVAGRGRRGRTWVAPPGTSLAVSTLLRLDVAATEQLGWLPLVAALALREAIAAQLPESGTDGDSPGGERLAIKWPNDLLLDGGKVAGILGEALRADADGVDVVIGTGINVRLRREDLPVEHATSLLLAGIEVDDEQLLAGYLAALGARVAALQANGWDAVAAGTHGELVAASSTLGQRVRVTLPGGAALLGEAVEIGPSGQLRLRDAAGVLHEIAAGDVERLRPAQ